ncbi:MAG: hypothetical protein KJ886_05100, partial [Candidatus Thermoplasmatota archaeon]|nr:hypothetical protein [Candidatus Thermoplasmatota archaeon]
MNKTKTKTKTNFQKNRTPNTTTILLIITIVGFGLLFWPGNAQAAPLAGANADMDQVAYDNAAVFTGETTDANDVDINDVQLCGNAVNDDLYFGMNYVFDQLVVKYSTACSAGHVGPWEYYDTDTTWKTLTAT